jgi:hypothetical protein
MTRFPIKFDHKKPKECRNCNAARRYIILCGDCWRIGVGGIAVGGVIVGAALALIKHFVR